MTVEKDAALAAPLPFPAAHYEEVRRRTVYRLLMTYLAPLLVLAIFFYVQSDAIISEGQRLHLKAIADNQANTLDLFLSERRVNLENLIDDPRTELPAGSADMREYLDHLKRDSEAFVDVGYFDASGIQRTYAGPYPYKTKLLIVDDEVKFLDSIAKRLEMRGFEVAKAARGEQAVELAREARFDLALLDLKMPGMNGKEVLAILKQEHKYLEVIILTGHGSVDTAVDCTKLGAFSYLPKPYELEGLLEVLRDAYEARLKKKFESNQARMEKLTKLATGSSPLGILRAMRELDDDEK